MTVRNLIGGYSSPVVILCFTFTAFCFTLSDLVDVESNIKPSMGEHGPLTPVLYIYTSHMQRIISIYTIYILYKCPYSLHKTSYTYVNSPHIYCLSYAKNKKVSDVLEMIIYCNIDDDDDDDDDHHNDDEASSLYRIVFVNSLEVIF